MSTEIIKHEKGMTSLQIAEVTGKRHDAVLRDIRNMVDQGAGAHNFVEASYSDKQGKLRPMYSLTPKGCLILASGYDVVLREKIIDKLEEYQKKERTSVTVLPDFTNPAEAARAWAEQFELKQLESKRADEAEAQVLSLTHEIETMQPKVSYYDNILANQSTVLTTQIAQDYGLSAKAMNKMLNAIGIQRKVNNQWILYAPYLSLGYVQSKPVTITHNDGRQTVKYNTEWKETRHPAAYRDGTTKPVLTIFDYFGHETTVFGNRKG